MRLAETNAFGSGNTMNIRIGDNSGESSQTTRSGLGKVVTSEGIYVEPVRIEDYIPRPYVPYVNMPIEFLRYRQMPHSSPYSIDYRLQEAQNISDWESESPNIIRGEE